MGAIPRYAGDAAITEGVAVLWWPVTGILARVLARVRTGAVLVAVRVVVGIGTGAGGRAGVVVLWRLWRAILGDAGVWRAEAKKCRYETPPVKARKRSGILKRTRDCTTRHWISISATLHGAHYARG